MLGIYQYTDTHEAPQWFVNLDPKQQDEVQTFFAQAAHHYGGLFSDAAH